MRSYTNYIIKSLALPIFFSTITLTIIIWLSQSLRYLSLIVNKGISFFAFIKLSVLIVPSLLPIILPISTFISVLYLYNKLMMDSELAVLKSAGLSRFALCRPALIVAFIVTIFSFFNSFYLLPISYKEFKDKIIFYRDNYASVLLEEKVFIRIKGLTIYIEEQLKDGTLKGILVHDNRNPKKPITIIAEKAKLIKTASYTRFELYNGNRQELNNDGQLAILYFDHFLYDLSVDTTTADGRGKEASEMFIKELLFNKSSNLKLSNKLIAEAHQRLTLPLYNIMLTIIALLAVFPKEYNRRGQNKRILFHTFLAIILMILLFILNGLVVRFPLLTPLIYLSLMAIISTGCYQLFFKR